jgi:membrane protein
MDLSGLWDKTRDIGRFLRYVLGRFTADGGPRAAAALSYSSLLALVPLLAITLAVLSAFDAFEGLGDQLQAQLFEAMLPEAAQALGEHVTRFVANAGRMTGPGILGLAVTAILLLNTITGAFGAIWHATEPRPLAMRVLVYWALLTLGPLLLGASVSFSTYAFAAVQWAGIESYTTSFFSLPRLFTFLLSALGCTLLFVVVPNRTVRPRHALVGALVAAFLLELLKRGFGAYLSHFPTYQAIYGALAAIPIFLVWMYLSWAVLLLGAEIAASLPEWRAAEARRAGAHGPGAKLALALALLERLRQAARKGRVLKERVLARDLPATLGEFDEVLRALRQRGWVVRSGASRWVLARDLTTVSLNDLVRALGLSLEPGAGWPEGVAAAVGALARAGEEPGRRSLAEILDQPAAEAPAEAPLRAID